MTLKESVDILSKKPLRLSPQQAEGIVDEVFRILTRRYREEEWLSPTWYDAWDDAFATLQLIGPEHSVMLPFLLRGLRTRDDKSKDVEWIQLYALRAIIRIQKVSSDIRVQLLLLARDQRQNIREEANRALAMCDNISD